MADFYQCMTCRIVFPIFGEDRKCTRCGESGGEVISPERVKQGMESGAFFNIDPKTGGRAKKKKKRQ